MRGYHLANLTQAPNYLLVGAGTFTQEKREWSQPVNLWSLIYYEHRNAVTQQSETVMVEPGDIVLFGPCVRGAHGKIGDDTPFQYFTFNLPSTSRQFEALPRYIPKMERVFGDLRRASARITDTAVPAVAFVWSLLWSISEPQSKFRSNDALYSAEAYIRNNLDRRITVTELSESTGLSSRQLLRLFREEHNQTIQDYTRHLRIQEACRLLLETDLPTKVVASRVGYTDPQEFNKLIRSGTGVSPTAFRSKA